MLRVEHFKVFYKGTLSEINSFVSTSKYNGKYLLHEIAQDFVDSTLVELEDTNSLFLLKESLIAFSSKLPAKLSDEKSVLEPWSIKFGSYFGTKSLNLKRVLTHIQEKIQPYHPQYVFDECDRAKERRKYLMSVSPNSHLFCTENNLVDALTDEEKKILNIVVSYKKLSEDFISQAQRRKKEAKQILEDFKERFPYGYNPISPLKKSPLKRRPVFKW